MRLRVSILLLTLVGARSAAAPEERVFRWPVIAPVTKTFELGRLRQTGLVFDVKTIDDKTIYWLGCRGLDFKGTLGDPYHDEENDYFGDMDCHLHSISDHKDGRNLLVDDAADPRENFSRLATYEDDLVGACGNYPEWGRVRNVRLRGMSITFEFKAGQSDVPVTEQKSGSMIFRVEVKPDPTALSAIAEPPGYDPPSEGQCKTVIQAHVPGMVTEAYVDRHHLGPPYPEIVPARRTEVISSQNRVDFKWPDAPLTAKQTAFDLPIYDNSGRLAYSFQCTAYVGVNGIDRWGIPCALFAAGSELNLLRDAVDLYSRINRATILPEQLHSECDKYPEWGGTRHFQLRMFDLTIRLAKPVFSPGEFRDFALKQVELTVDVEADALAETPVALPSRYINWELWPGRTGCSEVLISPEDQPSVVPSGHRR